VGTLARYCRGKVHRPELFLDAKLQRPELVSPRDILPVHSSINRKMKRKLDANDVPSPEAPDTKDHTETDNAEGFESLNLDPRLRQALVKEKFSKPTPVQAKAIPLALEGKDILGIITLLSLFISC
jgi:hypothetical protein